MFIQSQFHFHFTHGQKRTGKFSIETESNRIESNRIESNRIATLERKCSFARHVNDDPTRSVDADDADDATRAMDDKDISLNRSHAFHPSKSIRASAYASGVSRANQIRRSAYLQFASSIIQTRRRRRRRRRRDTMLTKANKRIYFVRRRRT